MRYAPAKRFVTYYGKVCGCFGTCTADRSSASRKRTWRSYNERSSIAVAGSGGNRNKQQDRKQQVEQQRLAQLHLEKNLQLDKKRRLEDQQLETLRLEKKLRLEQPVR